MIQANNVTLRFGKKALFEEVNIKFTEGNCYGIIGANGAGKSTFLKILSGELEPTQGDISITPGQRLSVLEQDHFKYDDCIVLDTVIMGNQRLYDIMKEKDAIYAKEDFTEEDGIRASELEGEFATMNGWEAESDAATLLETMTIRKYCTYYRIANEVYEAYHRKSGLSERIYIDPQDVPEELRDVAYYKRKKFVDVTEMYDIDSPEDFMRFATDHYGELGLSRLNVFASNDRQHGWMIVVSNSYSSNVGLAIEVATALYKAGAPLLIYDAEKLLRILLEEDYVRLVPDSYHNYLGYQEEGSVYELPWEYECSDDTNSVLTKEQYQAIVSLAEWQEVEKIKVP